jgi:hypothetical protein
MRHENAPKSLGVLTVATNIYIDYWREMVTSFDKNCKPDENVVLHVFTNRLEEVQRIKSELKNVLVVGHEIPDYRWPEATLLRYQIFNNASEKFSEDVLMHLDADMLITSSPLEKIFNASTVGQMCLVSHPGYWRPQRFHNRFNFYWKNTTLLFSDIRMILRVGGLGSWETDSLSAAYVPRRNRRNYVCGGTWFGQREVFLKLISELSRNVKKDLEREKVAVWHDESHLNSWSAQNSHQLLDPSLCFVATYPQLAGLTSMIAAVEKKVATR